MLSTAQQAANLLCSNSRRGLPIVRGDFSIFLFYRKNHLSLIPSLPTRYDCRRLLGQVPVLCKSSHLRFASPLRGCAYRAHAHLRCISPRSKLLGVLTRMRNRNERWVRAAANLAGFVVTNFINNNHYSTSFMTVRLPSGSRRKRRTYAQPSAGSIGATSCPFSRMIT